MFDLLGVLVGVYAVYAGASGEVIAKHRAGAQRVRRDERPGYFWTVVGIYAALALALVFVF